MSGLESLVSSLAQQALGMQNPQSQDHNNQQAMGLGGLGSILGNVLGGHSNSQQGGLGSILGSVLGANSQPQYQSQNTGGGLSGVLGGLLNTFGGANRSRSSALLLIVVPLVLGWIQKNGGLAGALSQLQGHGLGQQTQSWVSQGANQTIEPQQLQNLFDQDEINHVAQQANASPDQVYGAIASVLPEVVNSLTPEGRHEDDSKSSQEINTVMGTLDSFLKR